jgi:hypothetical protein
LIFFCGETEEGAESGSVSSAFVWQSEELKMEAQVVVEWKAM